MVNFGFSAFLKLLSQNEKPQKTAIRQRLAPSSGSGYDFHKQMRRLARRYAVDREPLADILAAASAITNPPEARAAVAALNRLAERLATMPGDATDFARVVYESPQHLFRVRFEPTFGLRVSGETVPVEIWNTSTVRLAPGPAYAALSLIAQACRMQRGKLNNVGVFSLQDPIRLYLLSDVPEQTALAATLVGRIEEMLQAPLASRPQPEDRPSL